MVLVLQVFALICVRGLFILVTRLWCNGQTGMRSPVVSSWKMHSHGCFLEGCAHGGQDWRSCLQAFRTFQGIAGFSFLSSWQQLTPQWRAGVKLEACKGLRAQ